MRKNTKNTKNAEITQGLTPLMLAIVNNDFKSFMDQAKSATLSDLNTPAGGRSFFGLTALMIAILFGHFEIVRWLVEQGVDLVSPTSGGGPHEGETPISLALSVLYEIGAKGAVTQVCQVPRRAILHLLVGQGVAFDVPMQKGVFKGSSVYEASIKEKYTVAVELFSKEDVRMAEQLKLFDQFLLPSFIRKISWTCRSDGLHYLALTSDPSSIKSIMQFLLLKGLKVEKNKKGEVLFILKTDLYRFLLEFEKNKKSLLDFCAASQFDSEVAAPLEAIIGKQQFNVRNNYLYISCNKRATCILEEFLRGFSASLEIDGIFESAWEGFGQSNYFRISLQDMLFLNPERFLQLIASLKNNLRKLEEFLEIAKALGASRHKNRLDGVEIFFAASQDGPQKFSKLLSEHFSENTTLYPYEKIIKISNADFTKMWEVVKALEPEPRPEPESKPRRIYQALSGWQFGQILFAGLDEKRQFLANCAPARDESKDDAMQLHN